MGTATSSAALPPLLQPCLCLKGFQWAKLETKLTTSILGASIRASTAACRHGQNGALWEQGKTRSPQGLSICHCHCHCHCLVPGASLSCNPLTLSRSHAPAQPMGL